MEYPIQRFMVAPEDLVIEEEEVLRYLGYTKGRITPEDLTMVGSILPEVQPILAGKGCYGRFPVQLKEENEIVLPYGTIKSRDLTRNLQDCREIYMFAVTIGLAFDRLLAKERLRSMAKASILQGIGAAAVEAVCDALNEQIRQEVLGEGKKVKPRYSPGFGDYTLDQQKGFFQILNPSKQIGVSLKENLIMVPEKSVTALIGVWG